MLWFDLLVVVIVIATLIKGFISGLIMQIASLAGIILGAIFAGQLSGLLAPRLIELFDNSSPHIIGALSYVLAFALIVIVLLLLGKMVQSLVKAIQLNAANRIAGALFCSLKWLIVFSILVNIVAEIDQGKHVIKDNVRTESYTYKTVTAVSQIVVPYLKFEWIDKE